MSRFKDFLGWLYTSATKFENVDWQKLDSLHKLRGVFGETPRKTLLSVYNNKDVIFCQVLTKKIRVI
jgi:hypothetical protein